MTEQIKNSAASTLASGIGSSDVTLTVSTGQGAHFPSSGNFRLVIDNEILLCTSRSADVLTVTRAQESTSAASHSGGAAVTLILTAGGLTQFISDTVNSVGVLKPGGITAGQVVEWNGSAWVAVNYVSAPTTNAQSGSTYTLVLGDMDNIVEMNNGSANTLTIPLNASVAFTVGHSITVIQTGAGQTTIAITGGGTLNSTPGLKIAAQWGAVTLLKRATDTWVAFGNLTP